MRGTPFGMHRYVGSSVFWLSSLNWTFSHSSGLYSGLFGSILLRMELSRSKFTPGAHVAPGAHPRDFCRNERLPLASGLVSSAPSPPPPPPPLPPLTGG